MPGSGRSHPPFRHGGGSPSIECAEPPAEGCGRFQPIDFKGWHRRGQRYGEPSASGTGLTTACADGGSVRSGAVAADGWVGGQGISSCSLSSPSSRSGFGDGRPAQTSARPRISRVRDPAGQHTRAASQIRSLTMLFIDGFLVYPVQSPQSSRFLGQNPGGQASSRFTRSTAASTPPRRIQANFPSEIGSPDGIRIYPSRCTNTRRGITRRFLTILAKRWRAISLRSRQLVVR